MRPKHRIIVSAVALMGVIVLGVISGGGPSPQNERPLPLNDIQRRGIEGRLGIRLGTIVEVTGEVVPNTSRAKRDQGIPFLLSIETVNGHALPEPVEYAFVKANQGVRLTDPKIGDKFHYAGYETGGFRGSPQGEFDYVPAYATTVFGFETSFLVLATK